MAGDEHAVLSAGGDDLILADIGVILDLVSDQWLGTFVHRLVEQGDGEVGHADIFRQPLALGFGQRAERLFKRHLGLLPVDQQ